MLKPNDQAEKDLSQVRSPGMKNQPVNSSNPIISAGIISKINALNIRPTANRLYGGYNESANKSIYHLDYQQLIKHLSEMIVNKNSVTEPFYSVHNLFVNKLNSSFSALGLYNEASKCINFKLIDKIGSTYSTRVFLQDSNNPVSRVYDHKKMMVQNDISFLNIPYLHNSPAIILPLMVGEQCIGVMIVGDYEAEQHVDIYNFMSSYIALFVQNRDLQEKVSSGTHLDQLTNLNIHRRFQELLSGEIARAKSLKSKVSIIMMDINNISQINRELGHAKGDEIIRLVADKVTQNIRSNDSAGRYGGDEIAIILPETDIAEAKYLAEYLTYSLSCCLVDDVGPIKVSVGIASYPDSTSDQEKLLILAEQAMYISKSRGYKNGVSAIVSSEDFDFWDDMALSSFASVLTKRHASIGINFEEELVSKFHNEEIISQNHLLEVVTSLAAAIDAKDEYTKGHSTSVSRYSEALARSLNLPEKEVERIKLGALLHDIGKIGIPENVLSKPTALSDEEWEIMKQHPDIGARKVLLPNESLHDLIPIVKYHHEHVDGSGYPERLKGEDIPLSARIVSVADAYHALISDRPYRKGLSVKKACEILKLGSGIQWDAELVRQFIMIAPSLATTV